MNHALDAQNLYAGYRDHDVLSDLSLRIDEGSITGLFGPNGVGKTTLLKALAGHLISRQGTVRVYGSDPVVDAEAARQVCLVGTGAEAPRGRSAEHTFEVHQAVRPTWDPELAARLVAEVNLDVKKPRNRLSLGQQSALAMIIGLASRAPLTLFDEVTVGMDAHTRHIFGAELARENAEHGRTFVVSTHLITDVEALVSDAVVLGHHGVAYAGGVEDLRIHLCVVTGKESDLNAMLEGLPHRSDQVVASRVQLGSTTRAVLRCSPKTLPAIPGIAVEPVSLENAVIALTTVKQDRA